MRASSPTPCCMADSPKPRRHRQLVLGLLAFVAGSFAFGFALVPLYDVLCTITGLGNQKSLTRAVAAGSEVVDSRRFVTVDFIPNLPTVGNWDFHPVINSIQVHPGKLYEATFFAHNLTGHATTAQAVPDIVPSKAASWFP